MTISNKILLILLLAFIVPTLADYDDNSPRLPSEEELEPQTGSRACPLQSEILTKAIGIGQICPESNQFWYYSCCGQHAATCCFHLQPLGWLGLGFLGLILLGCIVLQFVCGLLSCLCRCLRPGQ